MTATAKRTSPFKGILQPGSRAQQIADLEVGEYLSDTILLGALVGADEIAGAKTSLNQKWAAPINRAKAVKKSNTYRGTSFVAISQEGEVIVTYVIQRVA